MPLAPSAIDLTTLAEVKKRAEVTAAGDDDEIQAAITAFSRYLQKWSGVASLNSVVSLSEVYDGNGNARLFVRSFPVVSLVSVRVSGVDIPLSSGYSSWGAYVEQSAKSIGMRRGAGGTPLFIRGQGNVEVTYTAGYSGTPEDLEYAVRCVVALNYKRKGWQDQESRGVSAGGSSATTRYRDWTWPPEYQQIFEMYSRTSFI